MPRCFCYAPSFINFSFLCPSIFTVAGSSIVGVDRTVPYDSIQGPPCFASVCLKKFGLFVFAFRNGTLFWTSSILIRVVIFLGKYVVKFTVVLICMWEGIQ